MPLFQVTTSDFRFSRFAFVILTSVLLATSGCASSRINWAARVGSYTYDQAVLDLGPPDKEATLTDGTRVADWMMRRGGTFYAPVGPYGCGPYGYGIAYSSYLDYQIPDSFLRLLFGPEGFLVDWKKFNRY